MDSQTSRVQYFNQETYESQLGSGFGTGNGQFNNPFGITIDREGTIYVGTEKHDYTVRSATDIVTANYKTQYQVTFLQTGIDSSAVSIPVIRLNGVYYAYNALPSGFWVDSDTKFKWSDNVLGSEGKQFLHTGSSGTSPIVASGTYSATYKTQWQVTFIVSPSFAGSTSPSATDWYDDGFTINPLSATTNIGFTFASWDSSSSSIVFQNSKSTSTTATIGGTGTITANYAPEMAVPEYPLGALAALGACFIGLIIFKKRSSLPHLRVK